MDEPCASAPWANRVLTPMLRQYADAKSAQPDALLLFRMGDFYELFFDDAKVAAQALDLTLTARDKGPNPVPMAGVPHFAAEGYIAKLVALGYCVAICDQIEDPKLAKGIVKRAIVRVVTPATISDPSALDPGRSAWLASVTAIDGQWSAQAPAAVCLIDVLTGEMLLTSVTGAEAIDELVALGAREVLADEACLAPLRAAALERRTRVPVRPASARAHAEFPPRALDEPALLAAPPEHRTALQVAIAGALAYSAHTQRRKLDHIGAARWFHRSDRLAMDEATRANLELLVTHREQSQVGSLLHHLDRTQTPMGARLLRRWLMFPLRRVDAIARRADTIEALCRHREAREGLRASLKAVRDIARLSGRLALGRATARDVQALCAGIVALQDVQRAALEVPGADDVTLLSHWQTVRFPHALAGEGLRSLLDELPIEHTQGGLFRAGVDAELDACIELTDHSEKWLSQYEAKERQNAQLPGLKVRYNRVFGYFIEVSRAQAKAVPAHFVRKQTTAQAERYATSALESFAIRAAEATQRRCTRERELFDALRDRLHARLSEVQRMADEVARLDALQALAEVADRHRYVRPVLREDDRLSLTGARHPVLETLLPLGEQFVANDVQLDAASQRLMVLTGPNMAGKSTIMRQVAQIVLLAQMGAFVPCDEAHIGLCDQLFVRVGASDNLARGQSTFMVEMAETARILTQASSHSLVLLDEIGRGTSTFDGLSIAWAVAEYLDDALHCRALFATHYHELCRLADARPHVFNMQVVVHEEEGRIAFLRQLRPGAAGRSYGIEVARLAHVPAQVLSRAKQILAALEGEPATSSSAQAPAEDEALSACRLLRERQLELFETNAPPRRPPVRAGHAVSGRAKKPTTSSEPLALALASVDPERLTPLEALQLLFELKRRASA